MGSFLSTSTTTTSSATEKKKTKTSRHKPSSGMLHMRRNRRAVRLLTKKIARWERNKAEGRKANPGRKNKKPQRLGGKVASRNTWNTEGLKKQLDLLKK